MNRADRRRNERMMKNPIRMNVNPDSLDLHKCECGSEEFITIINLRRMPATLSPLGLPMLIPRDAMARCAACGAVARWAIEDQPKIITSGGDGNVSNVSVEGDVPSVEQPEKGEPKA